MFFVTHKMFFQENLDLYRVIPSFEFLNLDHKCRIVILVWNGLMTQWSWWGTWTWAQKHVASGLFSKRFQTGWNFGNRVCPTELLYVWWRTSIFHTFLTKKGWKPISPPPQGLVPNRPCGAGFERLCGGMLIAVTLPAGNKSIHPPQHTKGLLLVQGGGTRLHPAPLYCLARLNRFMFSVLATPMTQFSPYLASGCQQIPPSLQQIPSHFPHHLILFLKMEVWENASKFQSIGEKSTENKTCKKSRSTIPCFNLGPNGNREKNYGQFLE